MSFGFRRGFVFVAIIAAFVVACSWDPTRPFDREAPQVNEALTYYDAGEAGSAATLLQDYLATGGCQDGNIGTPLRVRERSNGSFDLGLALFKIAETYGHRFGDEEIDAGLLDPNLKGRRTAQVDCALRVVRAIAEDPSQPLPLRARARYLEGNLLFLTADYKEAVTAYDRALELAPGMNDAGPIGTKPDSGQAAYGIDPVGRDAAWNRAIALRRIEDKKDAGQPDASPGDGGGNDNSNDGGQPNSDGGNDEKNKDGGGNDDKNKDAGGKDSGSDDPNRKPPAKDEPDAGAPPPPPPSRQSQDERILDQLENAPTVQQEAAKQQAKAHRVRGMADK
jgi:tetratricopeptide (TPR) repeat protein